MTCPDHKLLEDLVLGLLPESEAGPLRAHLSECPSCLNEAAFAKALHLGLAVEKGSGGCLSDEELCHLRDGTLPDDARARALSHLVGCPGCATALRSLERSLLEAEQHPVDAPPALLERALALASPPEPEPQSVRLSWLQRILQGPLLLRLSVAGAAAALMLVFAFLFYPTQPAAPRLPGAPKISTAPTAPPRPDLDSLTPPIPRKDEARAADAAPPEKQPGAADRAAPPVPSVAPPSPERLAVLLDSQRRNLHTTITPAILPAGASLALGFAESAPQDPWRGSYLLGRSARSMSIFSRPALIAGDRSLLLSTLRTLPSLINIALAKDTGREVLLAFVDRIENMLDSGDMDAVRARIDILLASLAERLDKNPAERACFRLGQTVSDLLLVSAVAAYRLPPIEPAAAVADELAAARKDFSGPLGDLPQDLLDRVRTQLEIVAAFPHAQLESARARTLIAELRRLDRVFEPPKPPAAAPENP
ncbi:MAG: hypothetical protein GYA21_15910 [Myxococcales bacterium]|nr:hypothetical protein [Myxococcales bacterium]